MQTWWNGNAQALAQVVTVTVNTVTGAGNTFTATINGKSLTYTTTGTDTAATAASAWQQILTNQATAPPEFNELTWTVSSNVLIVTGPSTGQPFTLTTSAGSGGVLTQTTTQVPSSPSDVSLAANWLRGGTPGLPQDTDDMVVANSSVPLLWNLHALQGVRLNSYTRWQSFTGTIGLPENNPNGYWEYRPTYFRFLGPPLGVLNVYLGQGVSGTGPSRERYNTQSQQCLWNVIATGAAADEYAVRLLGTNGQSTLRQVGTSVALAMLPGETAALANATVDGGGTLGLGAGVQFGPPIASAPSSASAGRSSSSSVPAPLGQVTVYSGSLILLCAPGSVILDQGSQASILSIGLNYPSILANNNCRINYSSGSSISSLVLQNGSLLDKSSDVQPVIISAATIDGDCQVLDPNNAITWLSPVQIQGNVASGPFVLGRNRQVQVF